MPVYLGVCQRDCTSYYGFLEEEADRLSGLLEDFFAAEVCKKFPDPDCEFSSSRWSLLPGDRDLFCLFFSRPFRLPSEGRTDRPGPDQRDLLMVAAERKTSRTVANFGLVAFYVVFMRLHRRYICTYTRGMT